ncbi:sugar phosphate isomerase/epimerase [Robiginitalea sp. M366]|uniref:sugar phosphate isomerase/epimerase family protein n=1 Tax=Robiginitalea aestuariiviva TaxID=3036903 RepID=UPI00240E0F29|nr:sugar phosphate isomerase/epimerase family protein [Robiginitalea aestuariiviva]MDG1571327.1 sugar phosphate isomerase/epimerase [Robiginitalea aestuariiviva]
MKRRTFIHQSARAGAAFSLLGMAACKDKTKTASPEAEEAAATMAAAPFFKLSLAQWSIHRMIFNEGADPYSFAEKAKAWGFEGLEYVSQLYRGTLEPAGYSPEAMQEFVDKCNAEAEKHGMTNLLIMIDGQGDLATSDEAARIAAVANHHKWVDAAAAMGCHSIRVNLAGSNDPEAWVPNSVDGLTRLATYAADKNINILVENHGGLSSNAQMLASVMAQVGMDNCGTLPDFGNFCIRRNDPADYGSGCAEMYDIYQGVTELMPYAKAVSAKSHDFDAEGNEAQIDYVRMMQIVKDAGYTGFVGVEYEGNTLGEEAGIIATRDLLLKAAAAMT